MSFLKKYSILLIPVGIVLLAVVFVALTVLTNRSLAADVNKNSVAADGQIRNLLKNPVSADQWKAEKDNQDALEKEASNVVLLAQQCSMRELISYRIFPKPADTSQQVFDEFGMRYRSAIEQMIRGMNAMEAPSEMEIRAEIGESTAVPGNLYGATPTYNRLPASPLGGRTQVETARQAMIDAVCARRAGQIAVYANPTVFTWYEFWGDYKFPGEETALTDCWNSQVAFWIYEDVAATINAMNVGSNSVSTSPVKRLLGVTFTQHADYPTARQAGIGYSRGEYDRSAYSLSGGYGTGAMRGDAPEYIRYPDGGQLGTAPWTARLCNDDIDVVHFSVGVITASASVMPFMKELCRAKNHTWRTDYKENGAPQTGKHNQITILRSEVVPVNLLAPENASYRYGDEAVVRVNLVCEYLFNRAGYDMIKPDPVKIYLGQLKVEGQTTPGMQPGGMMSPPPVNRTPASSPPPRSTRKPARDIGTDF